MHQLSKALERLKFDIRMIDLNIKKRTLTRTEYEQKLGTLGDKSSNTIKLQF